MKSGRFYSMIYNPKLKIARFHPTKPWRSRTNSQSALTIVELLVVIVVIGILAAITVVSYSGIRERANLATLQADLKNASTKLETYKVSSSDESYPEEPELDSAGVKASPSTSFTYTRSTSTSYCLEATNNSVTYYINSDHKTITSGYCDWIKIGTQTWARKNLNVGTMVPGILGGLGNTTNQTDNSVIEKYCYQNDPANCETYGGLYQWNEAMQYVTTEGAQGICPVGGHIPTNAEWKTLEIYLGMTQVQADAYGWRGTDQGTQLKPGGTSGLDMPLAGGRYPDNSFLSLGTYGSLWSSSESGPSDPHASDRYLSSGYASVFQGDGEKLSGFSIRCLKD